MESLFAHIEGYGRRAAKRKANGRSLWDVVHEAERKPDYCPHVANPKPPTRLFGCAPHEAARAAEEQANRAVDAKGKRLRKDAPIFLAGVASYPIAWAQMKQDPTAQKRLRRWLKLLLAHLKLEYGDTLRCALLHTDEPYPHVHWFVVPALAPDGRLRLATVHPGRAAYERTRAAGDNNGAARIAYTKAMRAWLDDIHAAVFAPVGVARLGPRRQRLSLSELKTRQQAEEALARTLDAEQSLKAHWQSEIQAVVAADHEKALAYWQQRCREQALRLDAAQETIRELRARVAELETQLSPPDGSTP